MDVRVKKWGDGIGFIIPYEIAEQVDIEAGDIVELTVIAESLAIKKKLPSLTLEELISSIPNSFQYPDDVVDFVSSQAFRREVI